MAASTSSRDSRLATPIGLVTLALALLVGVLTVRSWWPPLRESDLPGALLLGTALVAGSRRVRVRVR